MNYRVYVIVKVRLGGLKYCVTVCGAGLPVMTETRNSYRPLSGHQAASHPLSSLTGLRITAVCLSQSLMGNQLVLPANRLSTRYHSSSPSRFTLGVHRRSSASLQL